jgi:hypothetical protein
MTLKQSLIRHSMFVAAATGIGLSAAPAHAQDECLLNGPTDGGASAFGTGSLACGANASASTGSYQTTIGSDSVVSMNATTAVGYGAFATDTGAIAIGGFDPGVDLQRTRADGADSIAIGHMAVASATGGIALGAGSIADQANTLSLGVAGSERRIVNLAAGTAATDAVNVGQLNAAVAGVTTNVTAVQTTTATHTTQIANLQTGLATTDENVAANTTAIATNTTAIAANTTAIAANTVDIADLQSEVGTLFDLRGRDRRDMKQGIASAVAMANAPMPSPGHLGYAFNGAVFRGEYAVGGSLAYRLPGPRSFAVTAGFSYAGNKNNAARIGVAGEF